MDFVTPLYRTLQAAANLDHTRAVTEDTSALAKMRQLNLANQIAMQQAMQQMFAPNGPAFSNQTGPGSTLPPVAPVEESPLGSIQQSISGLEQRSRQFDRVSQLVSPFNPELGKDYAKGASDLAKSALDQKLDALKLQSTLYKQVGGIADSADPANPDTLRIAANQINRLDPLLLKNVPFDRGTSGDILPTEANFMRMKQVGQTSLTASERGNLQHQTILEGQNAQRIAQEEVAARQREQQRDADAANRQANIESARADRQQRQGEMDFQRLNSLGARVAGDYRQATKEFVEKKPYFVTSYKYLFDEEGKQRPTSEMDSSSDMALRDSYLRMVHPNYKGSVYEKKELEKLAGLPTRFVNAFVRLFEGSELPNDIRYEMFNAMKRQFNTENEQQIGLEDANRRRLMQSGMPANEVDSWIPPFAIRGNTAKAAAAAPAVPAAAAGGTQTMTATNPKTGERVKSTDGGKTWQPM